MLHRLLRQDLTYWAPTGFDEYGDPGFDDPDFLVGRWEDRVEQFVSAKGDQQQSRAVVYLNVDVEVGGYLYRGTSSELDPEDINSGQILKVDEVPDWKGRETLFKIYI